VFELGQQFLTQGDRWHFANIRGGDDGAHAGTRQRRLAIDRTNTAMRDRTAQDGGVQNPFAGHVVDVLTAAPEETQILDALDRAADQGIRRAHEVRYR